MPELITKTLFISDQGCPSGVLHPCRAAHSWCREVFDAIDRQTISTYVAENYSRCAPAGCVGDASGMFDRPLDHGILHDGSLVLVTRQRNALMALAPERSLLGEAYH